MSCQNTTISLNALQGIVPQPLCSIVSIGGVLIPVTWVLGSGVLLIFSELAVTYLHLFTVLGILCSTTLLEPWHIYTLGVKAMNLVVELLTALVQGAQSFPFIKQITGGKSV